MCLSKRKGPACIVACLSVITLILSIGMLYLGVQFNSSGLRDDLASIGEYLTYIFYAIMLAALLAATCSCCGFLACCVRNRCIAVCFGVTLLPVAVLILGLGITITSVVQMPESEMEKFCVEDYQGEASSTQEEYK